MSRPDEVSEVAPHPSPLPASGEREGPAEREGEGAAGDGFWQVCCALQLNRTAKIIISAELSRLLSDGDPVPAELGGLRCDVDPVEAGDVFAQDLALDLEGQIDVVFLFQILR